MSESSVRDEDESIDRERGLLAAPFAQTDRRRIVATFIGWPLTLAPLKSWLRLGTGGGGNGKSKSAAAFGGTKEGNEPRLAVCELFIFFGKRNEDRNTRLDERLKTEASLGDLHPNCL